MMFFKELPDDINPGRIDLTPLGHAVRFIIPCDACGEFAPRRLVLACGHLHCSRCCVTCGTPEDENIHCAICEARSPGVINELPETTLRRLMFACSCNFQGTLQEIKQHVLDGQANGSRHSKAVKADQRPVGVDNTINALREELRNLKVIEGPTERMTKAYFCVELQTRIDVHKATKGYVETGSIEWVAAGYPIRFSCIIRLYDGKSYIVPFIATRNNEPSLASWPMKKMITFELYNLRGESVKSKTVATFANDSPVINSFRIACNPARGHGPSQFYPLDVLCAPGANILCEGHACFSVEFRDLPTTPGSSPSFHEKCGQSSSWFYHPAEVNNK